MELRIKEVLKQEKITTVALAEKVGITQPNMSNIVNNKTAPSLDTLEKIAEVLHVPITDLFEQPKKDSTTLVCPHCGKEIKIHTEK